MIDPATFTHWMGVLCDRFGRELKTPTMGVYFEILEKELDTAAFVDGCRSVIRHAEFFPSVQRIIDAGRPEHDGTVTALAALRAIVRDGWAKDDETARVAGELCGLWDRDGLVWRDWPPHVQAAKERQFLDVYQQLERDARARGELRAIEGNGGVRPLLRPGERS